MAEGAEPLEIRLLGQGDALTRDIVYHVGLSLT